MCSRVQWKLLPPKAVPAIDEHMLSTGRKQQLDAVHCAFSELHVKNGFPKAHCTFSKLHMKISFRRVRCAFFQLHGNIRFPAKYIKAAFRPLHTHLQISMLLLWY